MADRSSAIGNTPPGHSSTSSKKLPGHVDTGSKRLPGHTEASGKRLPGHIETGSKRLPEYVPAQQNEQSPSISEHTDDSTSDDPSSDSDEDRYTAPVVTHKREKHASMNKAQQEQRIAEIEASLHEFDRLDAEKGSKNQTGITAVGQVNAAPAPSRPSTMSATDASHVLDTKLSPATRKRKRSGPRRAEGPSRLASAMRENIKTLEQEVEKQAAEIRALKVEKHGEAVRQQKEPKMTKASLKALRKQPPVLSTNAQAVKEDLISLGPDYEQLVDSLTQNLDPLLTSSDPDGNAIVRRELRQQVQQVKLSNRQQVTNLLAFLERKGVFGFGAVEIPWAELLRAEPARPDSPRDGGRAGVGGVVFDGVEVGGMMDQSSFADLIGGGEGAKI